MANTTITNSKILTWMEGLALEPSLPALLRAFSESCTMEEPEVLMTVEGEFSLTWVPDGDLDHREEVLQTMSLTDSSLPCKEVILGDCSDFYVQGKNWEAVKRGLLAFYSQNRGHYQDYIEDDD